MSVYDRLARKYTDAEIADAFIFPSEELTKEELEESNKIMSEHRKKSRIEMDWKLKLWCLYMQAKFRAQDFFRKILQGK